MACAFKILVCTLCSLWPIAAREIRPRVVGGVPDDGHEFPFAVMLQLQPPLLFRTCSGSLIAPTWVLTAAHCTPKGNEGVIRVKYGDPTIPSNETKFFSSIIKGIPHPGFKTNGRIKADIGLLLIERISNSGRTVIIAKLSAVDYVAFLGLPVKYAGFGWTRLLLKGEEPPTSANDLNVWDDLEPPLRVGEGVVISCHQDGGLSVGKPNICVAPRCRPRQQPYFGDSGGPMTYDGRIIGVACGFRDVDLPIVGYTPVGPYLDWIYDTMRSV